LGLILPNYTGFKNAVANSSLLHIHLSPPLTSGIRQAWSNNISQSRFLDGDLPLTQPFDCTKSTKVNCYLVNSTLPKFRETQRQG